jgi:porin
MQPHLVMVCGLIWAHSALSTFANPDEVVAARVPRNETGSERDHLSGDWGGYRTDLVERGVHFSAAYVGEALGNVSGGLSRGWIYAGILELGLELDFQKLGLWENGKFLVSSIYPHGSSLTDKHVGDVLRLSNIDAYDSIRLYEIWYEHQFLQDKLSIRVGQLSADEEFATQEQGGLFLNSAHGWPAFVSANVLNGGPAFFVPGAGARVRYNLNESLSWQGAVYDGDTLDNRAGGVRKNRAGTRVHFNSQQGLFAMTEVALRPDRSEDWRGGSYKLGAWFHTADFPDLREDAAGGTSSVSGLAPKTHENNFGLYATAEKMICPESEDTEQGLGAFIRLGWSPPDRNYLATVANGGFTYTGLFPQRDEDRLGLGFIYAQVSRDLRRSEKADRDINGASIAALSDFEAAIELTYEMNINAWWTIQPDLQVILHPGGSSAIRNAVVVGLRTTIIF